VLLGGCQHDPHAKKSARELYDKAHKAFQSKKFKTALAAFEEVERQHPYSDQAGQALLMAGECALESKQYTSGITSLDLFVGLHPTSSDIQKALYLRALCYYDSRGELLKDLSNARNALQAFDEFLNRFPKGQYHQEMTSKKKNLLHFFSQKNLNIARFYKRQKNFSAALHHLSLMNQCGDDKNTLHPESLYEVVDCFHALGMYLAAQRICHCMNRDYPKDLWTEKARQQCKSKPPSGKKWG